MALTLNTSHPLYANLICCIAVENGALVDLLTPSRVFTPASGTSFGTGAYGAHFQSSSTGAFAPLGATISPAIPDDTITNPNQTMFVVFNDVELASNNSAISVAGANKPTVGFSSTGKAGIARNTSTMELPSTTTVVNNGAKSVAFSRTGETAAAIYVDGTIENSASGTYGFNSTNTTNYIGGYLGQGRVHAKFVWFVKFNKVLSDTEISDLHTSLGADNTFALLDAGGPTAYTITADTVTDAHTAETVTLTYTGSATAYTLTADGASDSHAANDVALTYNAAGTATITSEPLRDNTNTLLANQALDYVAIYDNATGALVLRVTGISTNASGIFTVSDAALTGGVTYKLDWKVTIQSAARMPAKAAV